MHLTGIVEAAGADTLAPTLAYSPEETADNRIWIYGALVAAVLLAVLVWWGRNKGRGGK